MAIRAGGSGGGIGVRGGAAATRRIGGNVSRASGGRFGAGQGGIQIGPQLGQRGGPAAVRRGAAATRRVRGNTAGISFG